MFFTEMAFASEAAGEAAAGGGGLATTLGSVYPNPANIWPTWLAFGILFFLLWKFAMPAILGMVDARAARIRESLEKAEETKVEAEQLMEDYKKQMAEARGEAAKVIEQGRKVAETMKDEIIAKANEEAEGMIAKAREALSQGDVEAGRHWYSEALALDPGNQEARRGYRDISGDRASTAGEASSCQAAS